MQKRIGDLFLERGIINENQVQVILEHSRVTGLRFGDAALQLGLITREQMIRIFGPNFRVNFFNLDERYFPENTRNLLTTSEIIELGLLPLGVKSEARFFRARKLLNLGALDPSRFDAVDLALQLARGRKGRGIDGADFDGTQVFLVLADQFLGILNSVYRVGEPALFEAVRQGKVDSVLSLYLGDGTKQFQN